jgi:adenine deaminase
MQPLLGNTRILGLGEVMDYPSVLAGREDILSKIDLFDNRIIDGHSAGLSQNELCAYRAVGIMTNHECADGEEAIENLRLGMYVQIREGSAAKNLDNIITGLLKKNIPLNRCIFCTDDKHLEDISRDGHISYTVKRAISLGVDPVEAIKMATINTAQCYRLKRLGAVAPGYSADLLLLSDLKSFKVEKVLFRGKVIFENGATVDIRKSVEDPDVLNTVRIPDLAYCDLSIKIREGRANVITLVPGQLITKKELLQVKTDKEGNFVSDNIFTKTCVIERHKATGNIGLGIVKGLNIKNGAIASTVAHDSHNLIAASDNDNDMLLAVKALKEVNGGLAAVSSGVVKAILPLPVAGLMSDKEAAYVETRLKSLLEAAKALGVPEGIDPFMTLSFLALPVIPELRVTDKGLFDVGSYKFISI